MHKRFFRMAQEQMDLSLVRAFDKQSLLKKREERKLENQKKAQRQREHAENARANLAAARRCEVSGRSVAKHHTQIINKKNI